MITQGKSIVQNFICVSHKSCYPFYYIVVCRDMMNYITK